MSPIKARGELVSPTDQINLTIQFKDTNGNPVDTDSFPTVSLIQPSGLVALAPTSMGVTHIGTGRYSYIFTIPINGPLGGWFDLWTGFINGFRVDASFEFIVTQTEFTSINVDGYAMLGDDPGFNYSQAAIKNINKLIKSLKARLNSDGKAKATDGYGNVIFVDCSIFSTDMLVTFLATALWEFNQIPYFTFFQFDDDNFVEQFGAVLVEYATLQALASKSLIERGREFSIQDQGIQFNPPTVSELLNTQYNSMLTQYFERIKYIKNSLRPAPKSLTIFNFSSSGINPAIKRLGHLREKRII